MHKIIITISILLLTISVYCYEVVNIGYYDNPPKIFFDKTTNKAAGFWADITNEIAIQEDLQINWIHKDWNSCYQMLINGQIDMLVDVAETEERRKVLVLGEESVMPTWSVVYLHKDDSFEDLHDLNDKLIGVLKESMNYNQDGGIADIKNKLGLTSSFVEFDSYRAMLHALNDKKVDFAICSKDYGNMYAKDHDIKASSLWFQPVNLKYAFNKNSDFTPYLRGVFDSKIKQFKKDKRSVYYKTFRKYIEIDNQNANVFNYLALVLVILLLAVIIILIQKILKEKYKKESLELTQKVQEAEKSNEELLSDNEKLEEINKFKDNFFRSVTHELRTPLHAIIGFSELIKNPNINEDEYKEYHGIIVQSSKKLLRIVNNIIEASQIQTKSQIIRNQEIELKIYLENKFKLLDTKNPNINKVKDFNIDEQSIIVTDLQKLDKILEHLIDNALKFTESGEITLGSYIKDNKLTIYVKDTGIGIAEKDFNYLFMSFTQIDSATSRKYNGTGLGLTIAKSLSEALAGKLHLESKLGEGSTFYLELPLIRENNSQ